mgnify:CR=1 FL=1|tara:strand:+ start:127 stop:402 length:276 start_codon:yes stop_codon:yes gene_type:complete
MTHPLHNKEFLSIIGKNIDRKTGRSTAFAFSLISYAILHPNRPIKIIDHHGTHESNKMLAEMIFRIIEQTGLQYLKINKATLTLKFARGEA